MFFEINKALCEVFSGLDPLRLLDYPAEDVFELINGLAVYNKRQNKNGANRGGVIRKKADDSWF